MDSKFLPPHDPPGEETPERAEAEARDRRTDRRHLTVLRVAKIANDKVERMGIVRNISEGGMMIDVRFPFEVGQDVFISLIDEQPIEAQVVWRRGFTIGTQFAEKAVVGDVLSRPSRLDDGRLARLPRLVVNKQATVKAYGRPIGVTICDVSQRGAKLKSSQNLLPNENIEILVSEGRPVHATVRWQAGDMAGVEFHQALPVSALVDWLPEEPGEGTDAG